METVLHLGKKSLFPSAVQHRFIVQQKWEEAVLSTLTPQAALRNKCPPKNMKLVLLSYRTRQRRYFYRPVVWQLHVWAAARAGAVCTQCQVLRNAPWYGAGTQPLSQWQSSYWLKQGWDFTRTEMVLLGETLAFHRTATVGKPLKPVLSFLWLLLTT